jgi:hypothetical protein
MDAAIPPVRVCSELAVPPVCEPFFMSFDDIYLVLLQDAAALGSDEKRLFTRYFGIAHRRNAGVCEPQLAVERWALSKLLNSLSTNPEVVAPQPVEGSRDTLFRIDIRDYGWDREVDFGGLRYATGWEALLGSLTAGVGGGGGSALAEFSGEQASALIDDTATLVPFVNADAFVAKASAGELYYVLSNARATLPEQEDALGLIAADVASGARAGLQRSQEFGVDFRGEVRAAQGRVTERRPLSGGAVFWRAFDFLTVADEAAIFSDPLGFQSRAAGTLAIYSLPNQLHGYFIAQGNPVTGMGPRQEYSDLLYVNGSGAVRGAVACMGCHDRGIIPVRDEVRDIVERNFTQYSDVDTILALYPPVEEMDRLIEADQRSYGEALERAGVPADCPDPVAPTARRFAEDLTLEDVLGELGTTRELFALAVERLDIELQSMLAPEQLIRRDDFEASRIRSLCILQDLDLPDAGAPKNRVSEFSCLTAAPPGDAGTP